MPDLVFSMGGDISPLERALNAAVSLGRQRASQFTDVFVQSARRIDKEFGTSLASVGNLDTALGRLKLAGGLVLGFVVLKEIIDSVRDSAVAAGKDINRLVEIGNKSRDAQVGTTFFQSFTGAAKQLGLEIQQAEGILNQARDSLDSRIGEGDGKNVSSLGADRVRQNVMAGNLPAVSQQDLANATSMEDRIRVILNLIGDLQAKNAQVAAFDLGGKVFGPDFETKLRAGVDIVGQMRRSLEGVAETEQGRVRSEEEIANAQRLALQIVDQNQRLAAVWAEYQRLVSEYNQGTLDIMVQIKGAFVETVEELSKVVGYLEMGERLLRNWGAQVDSFQGKLANALGAGWLHDNVFKPLGLTFAETPSSVGRAQSEAARDFAQKGVRSPLAPIDNPVRDTSKALPSLSGGGSSRAGGGVSRADEVETLIKSLDKAAAAEKGEADALGLNNKAKQESIDLAKAAEAAKQRGSKLTDEERGEILAAADAYSAAKQKIDDYNLAQQRGAQQAQFFGDAIEGAFEGAIVHGQGMLDILRNILQSLESATLKALLTGSGPLAGLFGTAPAAGATGAASVGGLAGMLFGAGKLFGFADGGPVGHYAGGGSIRGPGTSRSDSIPIMASTAEYTPSAAAARVALARLGEVAA